MGRRRRALDYFGVLEAMEKLIEDGGIVHVRRAYQNIIKQRVDPQREIKRRFPWDVVREAAEKQKWICPLCGGDLEDRPTMTHGDHVNPNLQKGLNRRENCQAVHAKCNLEKGSKSVFEIAKATGRTILEQLRREP